MTDEPFALLDDSSGETRLFTGFLGVREWDDPALVAPPDLPGVLLIDYEGRARLLLFERCRSLTRAEVDALLASGDAALTRPAPDIDQAMFRAAIGRIHEHIRSGDTYQVNYTFRMRCTVAGSPIALYRRLRAAQPVSYGALVRLPGGDWVLSRSPELFVHRDGPQLTTRPMKGTAARGATPQADRDRAEWLRGDRKSRAENLMIVDLVRNDLGQVAVPGSVQVPRLFDVEAYPSVWQLTSTVVADARPGIGLDDVLAALFPCGSITGAPKLATMRIIDELESSPRGLYTGAIGWVDPAGDFCLSVAIRTLLLSPRDAADDGVYTGTLGVGAGIVLDSDAAAEWHECLLKAKFLTDLADGLDTDVRASAHAPARPAGEGMVSTRQLDQRPPR